MVLERFEQRIAAIARNRTTPDDPRDERSGLELMAARLAAQVRRTSVDSAMAKMSEEAAEAAYILGMIAVIEDLREIVEP